MVTKAENDFYTQTAGFLLAVGSEIGCQAGNVCGVVCDVARELAGGPKHEPATDEQRVRISEAMRDLIQCAAHFADKMRINLNSCRDLPAFLPVDEQAATHETDSRGDQ